jgi:hypothetical protein
MNVDWENIQNRLRSYPYGVHEIRCPCSQERLKATQLYLGNLPESIIEMVRHFNGARLFIAKNGGGEMLTVFGISDDPPLSSVEWASDWYIDKFTPRWRAAGSGRNSQFAIGMTNYGGVILYENGVISEWDTAERHWAQPKYSLGEWFERILTEGDTYLRELEGDEKETSCG